MHPWIRVSVLLMAGLFGPPLGAVSLTVVDAGGQPLENAVVWVSDAALQAQPPAAPFVLNQVDRSFVPHVLPVPKGARVAFPNSDPILHHVYSFSPAKTFEIKLYKGRSPSPLTFGKSGVVEVGCNIHDWMLAYIVVVDSPHFALTDADGRAELTVPEGARELTLWHQRLAESGHREVKRFEAPVGESLRWRVSARLTDSFDRMEGEAFDGY